MAKTEREYRQDIIDVGKLVFQKGWVAANDGNISIRLDQDRILATPTGICKGMIEHDDLIIVVTKRAWGIKPPRIEPPSPDLAAAGAVTFSLQYGHTRSRVVIKARQCGHIRRVSMNPHCRTA